MLLISRLMSRLSQRGSTDKLEKTWIMSSQRSSKKMLTKLRCTCFRSSLWFLTASIGHITPSSSTWHTKKEWEIHITNLAQNLMFHYIIPYPKLKINPLMFYAAGISGDPILSLFWLLLESKISKSKIILNLTIVHFICAKSIMSSLFKEPFLN